MKLADRNLWRADPVTKELIRQLTESRYEIMECWARSMYVSTSEQEAEMRGQCGAISTIIDLIDEIGGLDESSSGEPGNHEM